MNREAIKAWLLDLFYPNRCGCCGVFIPWNHLLCLDCASSLQPVQVCPHCGKIPCNGQEALPYSRVYVAYAYADRAKDGILSLKRGHNLNFAMHLGKVLGDQIPAGAYDCIVPVPMNRQRLRERGYNQAERIGAAMGIYCGLPVRKDCLIQRQSKIRQHELGAKERQEHAKLYEASEQRLDGLRILLCDDVLTTGSTAQRCAQLLRQMGAADVGFAAGCTSIRKCRPEHDRSNQAKEK